ncbi:hypothetical protein Vretimale_16460 [Volvox reticuliferus]|uniref:GPI-anchored wall transfer protein n=1 Tax=Volvox reticuliferus TaxID=1737510 RepID=A0A8J4LXB4_9CHLO|nr:hypothetical protein Vretifemale_8641 [Volvox reticuliferus]GIM13338.1 hypothetical protein Vretimale_16460 [Volvox reticuliferus]
MGRRFALEMLLIIYPQLLICTGALPLWPTLFLLVLAASACCFWDIAHPYRAANPDLQGVGDLAGRRKSFVGIFRGALMAATCLCILAVDFRAFPRRYAKTEAYGTGYMDGGVGGVVLAAGLVSPAAGLAHQPPGGADGSDVKDGGTRWWRPPPLWRRLLNGLRAATVCWLLGLGRLVTTRAVDYQEHVGEYGVHWNFFWTIAVLALLGHAVALPPPLLAPVAIGLTLGHQAVLSWGGLGPWVMSEERGDDMISLNKEGIVSCVGFWALYLWGAALAHALHISVQPAVRDMRRRGSAASLKGGGGGGGGGSASDGGTSDAIAIAAPLVRWWAQFVLLDVLLWVAVAALEAKVEPISRRSCNAAYIVWIVAQCLAGMLPLALWQTLTCAASAVSTQRERHRDGCGAEGSSNGQAVDAVPEGHYGKRAPSWENVDAGTNSGSCVGDAEPPGLIPAISSFPSHSLRRNADEKTVSAAPLGGDTQMRMGKAGPHVLQAINSNQLAIFLAANLLTGAINLSLNTLQVADWPARALLGTYMTGVCGLALMLESRGWRFKL